VPVRVLIALAVEVLVVFVVFVVAFVVVVVYRFTLLSVCVTVDVE
jgi:hypothetical protein